MRQTVQTWSSVAPEAYTASQMTYDLRRLRLKGLIARVQGSHRYILTAYGRRVTLLMTKLYSRIFNVASVALVAAAAVLSAIAQAFKQIDAALEQLVANAHLAPAEI